MDPSVNLELKITKEGQIGMFVTASRDIKSGELITRAFQSNYSNVDLMEKFGHIENNNKNKIKIKMA